MIYKDQLPYLKVQLTMLLVIGSLYCAPVFAQSKEPIFTYSSGGGATGSFYPATTIPTYFGSIGQPMVMPRNSLPDNGGGVMSAAGFMFGNSGDHTFPVITYNAAAPPVVTLIGTNISVQMTDDHLAGERIYYRPILGGNFTQLDMSSTGTPNTFNASIALADSMGIEFYFKAFDSQNVTVDPADGSHYYAYTKYVAPSPAVHYGTKQTDYRIISTPFVGTGENIHALFGDFQSSDPSKYRIWQYSSGTWAEDTTGGFKDFSRGAGYFLIVSDKHREVDLKMSDQIAPSNNRTALYELPLVSDQWNLVGNPYPIEINWDSVMALNGNPGSVGSTLKVFSGTYIDAHALGAFQGAFVKVTGAAPSHFKIGMGNQSAIGGRIKRISSDLAASEWQLPFVLKQGDAENILSAVGMNPLAVAGLDRYDDYSPPHFFEYIDWISQRPELKVTDLTKDIVNTQPTYIWKFEPVTSSKDEVTISWDNTNFGSNSVPLYLYDINKDEVVDMRTESTHKFLPAVSQSFKVYYGVDLRDISPDELIMNAPFPNPFGDRIASEFRFALPGKNDSYQVQLELYNSMGQRVRTLARGTFASGRHSITWNGQGDDNEKVAAGLYIYRMVVDGRESHTWDGRVIYTH